MHIICEKENLLKGIRIIETAVSTKATLPILSNFLLETDSKTTTDKPNKVKIMSTDLEIGLKYYIEAKVISPGGCTIPAKRFGSLIYELDKDKPIEIKVDKDSHIDIKSGKSHFVLMGTSKDDYPALPEFAEQKAFEIETEKLSEMVRKTIFAVSTEETRYNLNGVYFVVDGKKLELIATDGRRLAYTFEEAALTPADAKQKTASARGIVPTKAINEVVKIESLLETEISKKTKFNITENQIAFQIGDVTIISRLIDGTFPNYEQVIPKKNHIRVEIDKIGLLSATKQISLLTAEKGGAVKFSFSKSGLKLSAVSQGIGSGEVDVETKSEVPSIETAFNPSYVIDILRNINENTVVFELNGSIDAVIARPVSANNYLCVVMPMRIS